MMRKQSRNKGDRKKLLEEETDPEGGVEMTGGYINARDPEESIPEKSPVSYVNIAFGQDSDEEDEEEEEEEGMVTQLISGAEVKGPTSLKLFPQRQEYDTSYMSAYL